MEQRLIFETKEHRITYKKFPATNPKAKEKIVLIGGWCSAVDYWKLNIPFFQEFGEVIEMDLIGHYPADILPPKNKVLLKEFLEAQASAIWEAAGQKDITLVGHSTGAMSVMAISALFPDRVKQTISIAPYVHGPVRGPLKLGVIGLRSSIGFFFDLGFKIGKSVPKFLEFGFSYGVFDSKKFHANSEMQEFIQSYYPNFGHLDPRNILLLLEMLDRTDIRPLVFGNKVPILLLRGDEDPVIPSSDLNDLEKSTPNLRTVHFAECGHFIHLEKKKEFEKIVRDFFSEKRPSKK